MTDPRTPTLERDGEESVGFLPHRVTVYEHTEKGGTLYLRWRAGGNWKKRSLRRPLRVGGKVDSVTVGWARTQAAEQYARLVAGVPADQQVPTAPLTLAEGLRLVTARDTGKYPVDSPHRREVVRELTRAIALLGGDTPWVALTRADLRKLGRARIQQLRSATKADGSPKRVGLRGAEILLQRVLAVAAWLRDEGRIPPTAVIAPRSWRQQLRDDWLALTASDRLPTPNRPRHTLAEMRKILAAAGQVDPRLAFLLALGAELRPGQVLRCKRSDLNLAQATLTVPDRGKKRGVVVKLTPGQLRVAEHHLTTGYLRDLEQGAPDYPLFPAGQMPGGRSGHPVASVPRHATAKPLARSVLDDWFHEAERLAGVPVVPGRAAYGLRRAAVDAAKRLGISREGLKAHGGWTDTQVPDGIYADQEMDYARDEARTIRAQIRGEATLDVPAAYPHENGAPTSGTRRLGIDESTEG